MFVQMYSHTYIYIYNICEHTAASKKQFTLCTNIFCLFVCLYVCILYVGRKTHLKTAILSRHIYAIQYNTEQNIIYFDMFIVHNHTKCDNTVVLVRFWLLKGSKT
jgi:hypothetical protein